MTLLASVLAVALQTVTPAPAIVPPESPPPAPHPLDWYFSCVAATARGDGLKGYSDAIVKQDAQKACGFIADKATAYLSKEEPDPKTAARWSRDYGFSIASIPDLTTEAVLKAGDVRALKVAALARSEHERK